MGFFKELWKKYKIIILIFSFIFIARGRIGNTEIDNADIIGFPGLLIYIAFRCYYQSLKYKTPQALTDGHRHSSSSPIIQAGPMSIVRCGDVDYGFKIPGSEGTMVVPTDHIRRLHDNLVIDTHTYRVRFEQLPQYVRVQIETHDYPKENIIFGVFPSSFESRLPEKIKSMLEQLDTNTLITHKDNILRRDYTNVEDAASALARLKDRMEGEKGFFAKVSDAFSSPSSQQDQFPRK